jgi:hypothetical protein
MLEWTKIFDSVTKVEVKSITDSLFRYSAMFAVLAVASAFASIPWVIITLFGFSGLLLLMGAFFYCFHSVKNPDYLRSETFQLKKRTMEMLGDKDFQLSDRVQHILKITSPSDNDDEKKIEGEL